MEENQIDGYFKSNLKTAQSARLLNQKPPSNRPHRDPDNERFRWEFKTLKIEMRKGQSQQNNEIAFLTTIISG